MKVLVTGAAGYIGSVLVGELLARGHLVLAFDNLACGSSSLVRYSRDPSFVFYPGDVRSRSQMEAVLREVDAIIPLAAIVGMPACDKDPIAAQEINLDAIRLLLELRSDSQRVIFPNTNSGYGHREEVCTEETPLAPISLYGRLKCEAERQVIEKSNTVSVRLATVFGLSPRMRRDLLVNDLVWRAMREGRLGIFEGHAMRNYVHVRDVADAFAMLVSGSITGVYNFGNDACNLSKLDLARKIAHYLRIDVGATNGEDRDKRNYVVSSAKLSRAGIQARIDLDRGIDELIRGYRCMPELYA